jgi:hypothetical protein
LSWAVLPLSPGLLEAERPSPPQERKGRFFKKKKKKQKEKKREKNKTKTKPKQNQIVPLTTLIPGAFCVADAPRP